MLHLEVDNLLVRLLVDPIALLYDIQTGRILKYEGVTNVADGSGKNFVARILFPEHYAPSLAGAHRDQAGRPPEQVD
ncbi:MAG: hypothetical protein HOC74_17195 [Gemmatimonadetes bacterium]|nr:hypothetical protein [Gemmatimonadota bacterium]